MRYGHSHYLRPRAGGYAASDHEGGGAKERPEALAAAIAKFRTAEERAYGYLGLAEGIIGKSEGNVADSR